MPSFHPLVTRREDSHRFLVVELVVVVLLITILAATALPKALAARREASAAEMVSNTAIALQAALNLYHSQWVMAGRPPAHTVLVSWGGLRVNAAGYPYGNVNNRAALARDDGQARADVSSAVMRAGDCVDVVRGLLRHQSPTISSASTQTTVIGSRTQITAVLDRGLCRYYFAPGFPGDAVSLGDSVPVLVYSPVSGLVEATIATL